MGSTSSLTRGISNYASRHLLALALSMLLPHRMHLMLCYLYICVYILSKPLHPNTTRGFERKKPKKRMEAEQIKTPVCGGDDNVNNSEKEKTKTALMRAFVERRDPDAKVSYFLSLSPRLFFTVWCSWLSIFGNLLDDPGGAFLSCVTVSGSHHHHRFCQLLTTGFRTPLSVKD